MTEFPWPPVSDGSHRPVWIGGGFDLDGAKARVLSYRIEASSGWTDALTSLHEDAAGQAHPIDVASRRHATGQLVRHVSQPAGAVVLEVGCSSGYMLQEMRRALPGALVIGSDYVRGPLEALAESMPEVPILHFDLLKCPLPDACVDAVVLLNVLEHIEDDAGAVRQLLRILKPGGIAVIEVPAGPHLYDVYDKALMHFRRYRRKGAISLFETAGFEVLKASHLGFFVYPAFWAVKKKNRLLASESAATRVVADNIKRTKESRLMSLLMKIELWLGPKLSYRAGIRCLLTCRKPAGNGGA
jgi:SAM-dependent methyltransferase